MKKINKLQDSDYRFSLPEIENAFKIKINEIVDAVNKLIDRDERSGPHILKNTSFDKHKK